MKKLINIGCTFMCALKWDLKMKLTALFLLVCMLQINATTYSQKTRISLDMNDVQLSEVLNRIETISEFKFFVDTQKIDVKREVNIKAEKERIFDILDRLFSGTNITYEVYKKQILLKKVDLKPATSKSSGSGQNVIEIDNYQQAITGTITDENGTPLPGANILEKGTTNGTQADFDGNFSIEVADENATLVVSYIGFATKEVRVSGQASLSVILEDSAAGLDEVVVVGYGTQKKSSLTSAISTMEGEEISTIPSSNISNSIGGRMSGILVRQVSGQPGNDASDIYIRGVSTTGSSSPLVVVDGIPRSFNELDPNTIENISVLKDASAVAPYGVAGANGVILVTTKKGKTGVPSIKYNGYYGIQNPTFLPDYVNFEQFAQLQNQIASNAGQPATWTDEDIEKHINGLDPDRYPNTNALDILIDKNVPITNHNIEISGGGDKVNYYAGLGYQYQQGMWKTDYKNRYSLILNLDAQVTNTLKVGVKLNNGLQKHMEPAGGELVNQGPEWIMQLLSYAHPNIPLFLNNGEYYGSYASVAALGSGEKSTSTTSIYSQLSIEQELPFIPGLSLKGALAYDPTFNFIKAWQTPMHIHSLDATTTPYSYIDGIYGNKTATLNETYSNNTQITWQGSLNYRQLFGKNAVSALALFEGKEVNYNYTKAGRRNYNLNVDELNMGSSAAEDISNSGTSTLSKQLGFVYRIGWEYDNKYLLEMSGRYDGHYYFAPGNRWGFFPSVSMGWRLSNENFIKNNFSWIDNLKIRASFGEVGALAGGPFQYLDLYSGYGPVYAFSGSGVNGLRQTIEPNKNITWERAKKQDIGLEIALWNGLLDMEVDYFYEKRSNMLVTPDVVVPNEYGIGLGQVNEGVMENKGMDLTLGSSFNLTKDLSIGFHGTFTYARNKVLEVFETSATYDNPRRRITGKPLGVIFGYNALGYFEEGDFDSSGNLLATVATQPWGSVQPGDLRYEDVNDDGKIDNDDIVQIGKSKIPEIIYGLSPNISYKNFSLNMLFQGAGNANFRLHGAGAWPFWGNRAAYVSHLDNWTPENPNARYPRVVAGQTANNQQASSWWVENTSYLRLKNATVNYNISPSFCEKIGLQNARISLSGQNLFTWTSVINFDPEMNNTQSWDYPQQTVYSVGVNLTF